MAAFTFLRRLLLAGPALLLLLAAVPAAACCGAAPSAPVGAGPAPAPGLLALPRAFRAPAIANARPASVAPSRQFDYMFRPRFWLMGGVHTVPTGRPLTAETSYADRSTFSQAGVGVGYRVSPALRAISNWNTGLSASSVSRGGQLTVGVTWRH